MLKGSLASGGRKSGGRNFSPELGLLVFQKKSVVTNMR